MIEISLDLTFVWGFVTSFSSELRERIEVSNFTQVTAKALGLLVMHLVWFALFGYLCIVKFDFIMITLISIVDVFYV